MYLCPTLVTGNQSLRESPAPGLSIRVECARGNTQGLCSIPSSFLTPIPWTNPNSCNPTLWRVLSSTDGVTQKNQPGDGNPNTRRHGAYGVFQSSSSPEAPHPLGAVGIVSLQEDPLGLEVVGRCRGEQARQVHGAGLIGWYILPSSISPMTVHPWEPSLPRLQGCASSPGHYGLREIQSASSFYNLYFVLV